MAGARMTHQAVEGGDIFVKQPVGLPVLVATPCEARAVGLEEGVESVEVDKDLIEVSIRRPVGRRDRELAERQGRSGEGPAPSRRVIVADDLAGLDAKTKP